jgi:hypothetical protein
MQLVTVMAFADYVPTIINGVMWGCWIVLIIYAVHVLIFILWHGKIRRMREAMAVGYTAVAAYYTALATYALPNFVQRVVGDGGSIGSPTSGIYALLVICSSIICAAFICNFSRSLWMLKNLDHAVFAPVPRWRQLSSPMLKRSPEFLTRMAAALLFIVLELQLEKVAHPHGVNEVNQVAQGSPTTKLLSQAGLIGFFLYSVLIFWWFSGLWIARSKMPKKLVIFYVAGLFNSIFIYIFGDEAVDESQKNWLLILVLLMGLAASYMIGIVLLDILKLLYGCGKLLCSFLADVYRNVRTRINMKPVTNSQNG